MSFPGIFYLAFQIMDNDFSQAASCKTVAGHRHFNDSCKCENWTM